MFQAGINARCGSWYYNLFHLPRIKDVASKYPMSKPILHLSFDIDMKEDIDNIPQLLQSLSRYRIKASFAVIGKLIKQYPDIHRALVREGHELINHTFSHQEEKFDELYPVFIENEIRRCHTIAKKRLGYEFKGFRIPHFGNQFTKKIYPILNELKYSYSSSTVAYRTLSAGFPYHAEWDNSNHKNTVIELPLICCPVHPFCIFDSSHAFRSRFAKHTPQDFLDTFQKLLDQGIKHNMFLNIYLDPQDLPKFNFNRMLEMITESDIEVKSYNDITAGFI